MNERPDDYLGFIALVDRYASGTIDEAGMDELRRRLAEDERARAWFRSYHELAAAVAARAGAAPAQGSTSAPVRAASAGRTNRRRITRTTWVLSSIAAALLLSAAVLVVYVLVVDSNPDAPAPVPNAPVATLIETSEGSTLTTPHDYPSEGSQYGPGEYTLGSGSAEFMLSNAVNVVLRGQTRLFMRDPMNIELVDGTASFVVPEGATGFTVRLPGGVQVVDLGTRFEVEIGDDGARVRVLEGEVAIRGLRDSNERTVGGDQVALIASDGALRSIDHDYGFVYVSATAGPDGNTVNLADGLGTTWSSDNDNSGENRVSGDHLWGTTPLAQGYATRGVDFMPLDLVWESSDDDAPAVRTTVSDLNDGTYEVYLVWSNSPLHDNQWDINAKLSTDASFATYRVEGVVLGTVQDSDLRRVLLGRITGTSFSVDVDDTPGIHRTRYVGVAYRRVAPADPSKSEPPEDAADGQPVDPPLTLNGKNHGLDDASRTSHPKEQIR